MPTIQGRYENLTWDHPEAPRFRSTPKISSEKWEELKPFIQSKYGEGTLEDVLKALAEEHKLKPTPKQLRYRIEQWKLYKYESLNRCLVLSQNQDLPPNSGHRSTTTSSSNDAVSSQEVPGLQNKKRIAPSAGPVNGSDFPSQRGSTPKRRKTSFSRDASFANRSTAIAGEATSVFWPVSPLSAQEKDAMETISDTVKALSMADSGINSAGQNQLEPYITPPMSADDPDLSNFEAEAGQCKAQIVHEESLNLDPRRFGMINQPSARSNVTDSSFIKSPLTADSALENGRSLQELSQGPTSVSATDTNNSDIRNDETELRDAHLANDVQDVRAAETLLSLSNKIVAHKLTVLNNDPLKPTKDAADYLFHAGMFSSAFNLYRQCYDAEYVKNTSQELLYGPSTSMVLKFTDMVRAASSNRAYSTVRRECKKMPWLKALDQKPWSIRSALLFFHLGLLQRKAGDLERASYLCRSAHDYCSNQMEIVSEELSEGSFREIVLVAYFVTQQTLWISDLPHKPPNVEPVNTQDCALDVSKPFLNILDYLCQALNSQTTQDWLQEMPTSLWRNTDLEYLTKLDSSVLYALLSKAYNQLTSMTMQQLLADDCALKAADSFFILRDNYEINPYAIIRGIVLARIDEEKCYPLDWVNEIVLSSEDLHSTYRKRMGAILTNLRSRCESGDQDEGFVIHWNSIGAYSVPLTSGAVSDEMFRCFLLFSPNIHVGRNHGFWNDHRYRLSASVRATPVAIIRHSAPNQESTGILKAMNILYDQARLIDQSQQPGDVVLLSGRSSQISEFSNFKALRQSWSTKSGISFDVSALPTDGLKRSSLGLESLRSLFGAESLRSFGSRTSLTRLDG